MTAGFEYRKRAEGVHERFQLVGGEVRKAVVILREDHVLLVDVKRWKPSSQRLRRLRRQTGKEGA